MTRVFLLFWAIGLLLSLHEQRKLREFNRRMFPSMQQDALALWPLFICSILGAAVVAVARYTHPSP